MKLVRHNYSQIIYVFLFFAIGLLISSASHSNDYNLNHNPQSYVLNKFKTNDIVFLGTRHKQPAILNFISEIITALHNFGVTRTGLFWNIYQKSAGSCVFFQYRSPGWINFFFSAIDPLKMLP